MDARETLLELVRADLMGPATGAEELLTSRPSDRYLTGILYPRMEQESSREVSVENDDDRDIAETEADGADQPVAMDAVRRPSSMGVSFFLDGDVIVLRGTTARYVRRWRQESGTLTDTDLGRAHEVWIRQPLQFDRTLSLEHGLHRIETGVAGLVWWLRVLGKMSPRQVTVILENINTPGPARVDIELSTFFQAEFQVAPGPTDCFIPRRPRRPATDEDGRINELIYRNVREFAIGHVSSVTWSAGGKEIQSSWLPTETVQSMSALGHRYFREHAARIHPTGDAFDAGTLEECDQKSLARLLRAVPDAYRAWQVDISTSLPSSALDPEQRALAVSNLEQADHCAGRMEAAIDLLASDPVASRAFRLSQRAMLLQRRWTENDLTAPMTWRPFQLGFQLLSLPGLVRPRDPAGQPSPDRLTMDLLWFPTGGGKTEAYLGLVAFLLFHRRLRQAGQPDDGAGVAALMRYTLRLLTVQQFERASRMILACEHIRRELSNKGDASLGAVPFSIGLWVGQDATPNTVEDARKGEGRRKARQLTRCPCCRQASLRWDAEPEAAYVVRCTNDGCPFYATDLPLYTIDQLIYERRPSFVIGTVDKFAQICRKPDTCRLLGAAAQPPDLIVQDELHLISGPLGTVVGIYEAAIDRICARPKIVGSTATIRRADDQVRRLFDRQVFQFPPPVLDWADSCFAVVDVRAPGRTYVGVTTAGRSPKFALQALCAALLQRAHEPPWTNEERDPFWTLVAYFNSMRELGGAHVMMLDDVNDSMRVYAQSRGAAERPAIQELLELSSRVSSEDIPDILERLERRYPSQDVSVVLATNMISVGVDIPRLGFMVVNGQPKSMAEYIQATSRVGRGNVPGLIVTVYNAGRARDRAHYESFRTWHQALYRDVEATSVTPFAPRARDKALHAAVVALARHLVPSLRDDPPALNDALRDQLETIVRALEDRARSVDYSEADAVGCEIGEFLDRWQSRGPLNRYWDDSHPRNSLLVSAEYAAARAARTGGWSGPAEPTPNTMREVEPSVRVRMTSSLSGEPRGSR